MMKLQNNVIKVIYMLFEIYVLCKEVSKHMLYLKHQNIIINISIMKTRLQSSIKQKGITLNLSKCPWLYQFLFNTLFIYRVARREG